MEAIANGCVYIQPRFPTPINRANHVGSDYDCIAVLAPPTIAGILSSEANNSVTYFTKSLPREICWGTTCEYVLILMLVAVEICVCVLCVCLYVCLSMYVCVCARVCVGGCVCVHAYMC